MHDVHGESAWLCMFALICNEVLIVSYDNITKYPTVLVDSKQGSPDAFDSLSLGLQHRSKGVLVICFWAILHSRMKRTLRVRRDPVS